MVECYSGRKADERPVRFWLDERQYEVEEVVDRWYGPEDEFFKVKANDGNLYVLRHQRPASDGHWRLDAFCQATNRAPSLHAVK